MFKNLKKNVKREWRAETALFRTDRKAYVANKMRVVLPVLMVMMLFAAVVAPSFAQDPAPTLDLDAEEITDGLFSGANIIIGALGAIMFLLAGFSLGGILLRGIVSAIGRVKF